jgi:DNA-3-methyladenine glycosylase
VIASVLLSVSFYRRPVLEVARDLLGARLVRYLDGQRLSGTIVETEAYRGEEDLACHARAGYTKRTAVMYGPPGRAYVYFNYGMHWLLNCVTGEEGFPAAVLVRAIRPTEGLDQIEKQRTGQPQNQWTNGPAKLCKGLMIDGVFNGHDLCEGDGLYIEAGHTVPPERVFAGPRVGIEKVPEPWRSIPWRFRLETTDAAQFDS